MLSVSTNLANKAAGAMRKLHWRLFMAFDKEFDDDIDFFTIEESLIEGGDFIKPEDSDVVQEWDKYQYKDLSNRVLQLEWSREVEPRSSLSLAIADITLNNVDDYFTPGGGSEIQNFILPYRPVRFFAGFGAEAVPVFVGLTEKMPVIDEKNKTVSFHCIDFLYSLLNRPLDETVMLEDARTDECLAEIFEAAGLLSTQYNFEPGFNVIRFFYAEKGEKLINIVRKLLEAESGRLYMDETGMIQFKNRQTYESASVYRFDAYSNIVGAKKRTEDDIINVVTIKSNVREVQALQKYWELADAVLVPAGGSVDIWADFNDPVTSINAPGYITGATTSLFTTNVFADGSGDTREGDVALDSATLFSKSYKMTFTNSGDVAVFITTIELFATPAKVVKEIYVREQDDSSVAKYDERPLEIDNEYFRDESEARSKAIIILQDFAEYGGIEEIDVKGTPALQLDDPVIVDLYNRIDDFRISKVTCKIMSKPARFTQLLQVKKFTRQRYFTIEESLIEGDDGIAP